MPNFTLKDLKYSSARQASLKDFNGKWLILDFWSRNCGSCVESFPHIYELQKEFKDKIQFILIGLEDKEGEIRRIYDRYAEKEHLKLTTAFDSSVFRRLSIPSCPYIMIIDKDGIIRGKTYRITANELHSFLGGKTPYLPAVYNNASKSIKYDGDKRSLMNDKINTDSQFIYRGLISLWKPEMGLIGASDIMRSIGKEGYLQIRGAPLRDLYRLAYFNSFSPFKWTDTNYGKVYPQPILEMKDTSEFEKNIDLAKGLYCLGLFVRGRKLDLEQYEKIIQNELANCFAYQARVETRQMPYWKLVVKDKEIVAKLKTNEKETFRGGSPGKIICKNISMRRLIGLLCMKFQNGLPFIDETGIKDNIDITIEGVITNISDIKHGLNVSGLDLVEEFKDMQVLVIKDP
jgi:thiol-disulfide isomerase/thioredoxin